TGAGRLAAQHHVAVQLDVVAVGAHLAATGTQVPHFVAARSGGRVARNLVLRAGVIVHAQVLEIDGAGFGLLADDPGVEPVAFAAVVAGFDDFRVARRVAGIRCRDHPAVRAVVTAPGEAEEIGHGNDADHGHVAERACPTSFQVRVPEGSAPRVRRASSSQSHTSRTAPRPPGCVVTRSATASASRCASATAMATPAACSIGASGVSSPTQAQCSSATERDFASRVSAATLSSAPCVTWRMRTSRLHRATAADLRPEMMATVMPKAATWLMAWPSLSRKT